MLFDLASNKIICLSYLFIASKSQIVIKKGSNISSCVPSSNTDAQDSEITTCLAYVTDRGMILKKIFCKK